MAVEGVVTEWVAVERVAVEWVAVDGVAFERMTVEGLVVEWVAGERSSYESGLLLAFDHVVIPTIPQSQLSAATL